MRIHYLQHDHFEDLSSVGEWAKEKGHDLSCSRMDIGDKLPDLNSFDWLIVMGGKMGVYESKEFPWLDEEIKFILQTIESGKTVLGICLGAQLLAAALGSRVYMNIQPEIGFFPVSFNDVAQEDNVFRLFGKERMVLHIHNDTFDLPVGAVVMASSAATANQAFKYKENVYAFQFHFEVNSGRVDQFIRESMETLPEGDWIQPVREVMEYSKVCHENNLILWQILDALEFQWIHR
jgi:GMP synthase-like glutamine amidotransferase